MTQTIKAHFDGKVIVRDEPVEFPPGQPLRVHVEGAEPVEQPLAENAWRQCILDTAGKWQGDFDRPDQGQYERQ